MLHIPYIDGIHSQKRSHEGKREEHYGDDCENQDRCRVALFLDLDIVSKDFGTVIVQLLKLIHLFLHAGVFGFCLFVEREFDVAGVDTGSVCDAVALRFKDGMKTF